MKKALVMIIMVNRKPEEEGVLTLRECGFKVGDVVEIEGYYRDGTANTQAIRDGEGVRAGDNISLEREEFVILEGEL